MNKITVINVVDAFSNTAVGALLPLLLAERHMSLEAIGAVFALMPIAFLVTRLVFASVADTYAVKPFFVLNCVASAGAYGLYGGTASTVGYTVGRVCDGVSQASIWAVNRTAAIANKGKQTATQANSALIEHRQFALAAGTIAAGAMATVTSITNAILVVAVLELAAAVVAVSLPHEAVGKVDLRKALGMLNPRGKWRRMWGSSMAMGLRAGEVAFGFGFTLPLYLNALGHSFLDIGLLLAMHYAIVAVVMKIAKKSTRVSAWKVVAATASFITGAGLLAFNPTLLPIIVPLAIIAAGEGYAAVLWEGLIAKGINGSDSVSTDIGLLHVPANLSSAACLLAAGVITAAWGFGAAYAASAVLFTAFMATSVKVLGRTLT